ncbi:MAG: hypothetical protein HN849_06915, partial [Victivallales bacterium]|nr:hypothetical protein [Victivallales bacterium]
EAAAKEILSSHPPVNPLVFAGPIRLELRLADSPYLEALHELFPEPFVTPNDLLLTRISVTAAWSEFLHMQREAKQLLASR